MPRPKSRRTAGAPALRPAVADLRALAHPLRLRIMELFAESPKTTKQVAELLGEPPTRLYHHVAALERAGLVVIKETRQNRGAIEKWYASVAAPLKASGPRGRNDAAGRRARRALAATVFEQAKQEVMAIPPGAKQRALITRLIIPLHPSKIAALRQRLFDSVQAIGREFRSAPQTDDAREDASERWALTLSFTPVATPKRSRR
ncbi:MAG TPA: winged helix-turn-helix domain-containing protein [Gemmatimonadaceae bacterium]|jgi:DNA-binding transcriptional ArsR family regulator